jgi:3-hydroxyacyl-[acyl-carrier-protein] dehydratase
MSITTLIPQRPPMVMIDQLMESNSVFAISSFQILPQNIFVHNGKLAEPGLIENIAQTAAAMVGQECANKGIPVPIGFIAAIKELEINSLPEILSTINTTVRVTNTVLNVTIIEGVIRQFEKIVCSCEMKILIRTN